ncbi:MAG: DNA polymerase III subunit gamma/tau, partial [Ginsengibacter sp.]
MDKFIVSARKYRPQNFNSVVGQSHITTTLKNAIRNNQLAHAFLFCGPRGVGKTTCARILAKTINCENLTSEIEACNVCNSCVSFENGTSLNIHELDAASNNSVDDIRTLVDQVRFVPQAGKYKIYIVDEVHMLSASAFNAFLKTLEEPPPYAIFILATTEKHKILPTILSRCQIFDFKRITNNDTVEHLQEISEKEHISAERTALHVIAQKSEGCLRDALSILDKIVSFTNGELTYANTLEHLNILDEEYFFRLLQTMQLQDMAATLLMYDEINRKGFEGDMVINSFAEFIRNVLVCKDDRVASLLEVSEDFKPRYQEVAKHCSLSYLLSALQILNDADLNYKMARNKRLHVELALIKLCYLEQAVTIANDGDKIHTKKQLTESGKPVAFKVIQPIALKSVVAKPNITQPAKLIIEQSLQPAAKEIDVVSEPEMPIKKATETPTPVTRLGSLDKLRQKVKEQNKAAEPARPL